MCHSSSPALVPARSTVAWSVRILAPMRIFHLLLFYGSIEKLFCKIREKKQWLKENSLADGRLKLALG